MVWAFRRIGFDKKGAPCDELKWIATLRAAKIYHVHDISIIMLFIIVFIPFSSCFIVVSSFVHHVSYVFHIFVSSCALEQRGATRSSWTSPHLYRVLHGSNTNPSGVPQYGGGFVGDEQLGPCHGWKKIPVRVRHAGVYWAMKKTLVV